jgi:hypothetical protein
MATSNRYPIVRRNNLNVMIIRTEGNGDNLDFISFVETDDGIKYEDTSGHRMPLKDIIIESNSGTFGLESVVKTRLAEKMCKVLGETENYYIIKGEQ